MATAKKMKSGSWKIQPSKKMTDGSYIRVCITAPSKKEAERLAAKWYDEQTEIANKKMTLDDAIDLYIQSCTVSGASPSTIKEYTTRRKNSYPDLIDLPVKNITPAMVQKQINSRCDGHSIKTVRNDFYLLKPVLAMYAPDLDLRQIKIAKKPKRKKLKLKESWRIQIPCKIAELYGQGDFYLYVMFIIFAGLRPSESYALYWSDISTEPIKFKMEDGSEIKLGTISVSKAEVQDETNKFVQKDPKTEAGKRIQIVSWDFIELLLSLHADDLDHKIISHSPYRYSREWKRIKAELGIPKEIRRYDLRHLFATSVAHSGASEEELAALMGHSTGTFSHEVYVEIFEEHQDAVNAALAVSTSKAISSIKDGIESQETKKEPSDQPITIPENSLENDC